MPSDELRTSETPAVPGGTEDAIPSRPFRPSPWLPGPHLQTLGGKLLRPGSTLPVERVRLHTPDQDFLDLDVGPDPGRGAPVVLILHGLEGSSDRRYVRSTLQTVFRAGMRGVAMNFRGCSGEPNLRPRFYHSGETGDLDLVVSHLRERFPGRALAAVGWSLGGNVLLKFLGERADRGPEHLEAAVAISVPFDLAAGARKLEGGVLGPLYARYFLRMLRKKVRWKRELLEGLIDVERALEAPTIWRFDDVATAPLHGFRDAADYYERSSSSRFLDRIRVPTLLIQSRDDPFLPVEELPEDAVEGNPFLASRFTHRGGHVGFVEGAPWAPSFWAEAEGARFLAGHLIS